MEDFFIFFLYEAETAVSFCSWSKFGKSTTTDIKIDWILLCPLHQLICRLWASCFVAQKKKKRKKLRSIFPVRRSSHSAWWIAWSPPSVMLAFSDTSALNDWLSSWYSGHRSVVRARFTTGNTVAQCCCCTLSRWRCTVISLLRPQWAENACFNLTTVDNLEFIS